MLFRCLLLTTLSFLQVNACIAQHPALRTEIRSIAASLTGDVGVAIMHIEKSDTMMLRGNDHFAMQSVYKFPLALAILHDVDEGKFSLSQKIHITREELVKNTWSPIATKYPEGNITLTLEEILRYTVEESDNNGCDILFRLVGGTSKIETYIHSLGVKDISISKTEAEMAKAWSVQFLNWSTPAAMARLLELTQKQQTLAPASNALLLRMMAGTYRAPDRIRAGIPEGTFLAHRPGTGDANHQGIIGAINDVGIVTLPDGNHLVVVVFISKTPGDVKKAEEVIAAISGAAFRYFSKK